MTPLAVPLVVVDLGTAPYDEVLALQHRLVAERPDADHDTLILVEHPAVITLGRRRSSEDNVVAAADTPVVRVERGGDVTWHGPGQLVGYPILQLAEHERDVHLVLRRLEDVFIALLAEYGLAAARRPGHTGVWVDDRKLVSLGIAVHGWVTFHGFALNVDCDLAEFARINPCGLDARVMGSLAALGVAVPRGAARDHLKARIAATLAQVFARRPLDPDGGLR